MCSLMKGKLRLLVCYAPHLHSTPAYQVALYVDGVFLGLNILFGE